MFRVTEQVGASTLLDQYHMHSLLFVEMKANAWVWSCTCSKQNDPFTRVYLLRKDRLWYKIQAMKYISAKPRLSRMPKELIGSLFLSSFLSDFDSR